MLKLLSILSLVAKLVPALIEAINAIEAALPRSGMGAAKLEAVLAIVRGVFETIKDVGVSFDDVRPALERAIGALVGLFNSSGLFKKG